MNKSDQEAFKKIMNAACDTLGKPRFDTDALTLYFAVLEPYTFEQVQKALFESLSSQDSKFGITPALIVKFLGVKEARQLNWQDVIEMARFPKTPMAVLARIHIKSFYLDSYSPIEIKHRADTFLDGLEDMRQRALAGEYTEHEIVTMIDRGVKVSAPFMEGMPALGNNIELRRRYNAALRSPLHIENAARSESRSRNGLADIDGQKKIVGEIKGLLSDIPEEKPEMTGKEAAKITGIH